MILLLGPEEQIRAKVRDLDRDGLKDQSAVLIEVRLQVIVEDAELVLLNCHHATKPPKSICYSLNLIYILYHDSARFIKGLILGKKWGRIGTDFHERFLCRLWPASAAPPASVRQNYGKNLFFMPKYFS